MTNTKKSLIVIVGPTGSGKTDLSISLATHFNCPIISTDSRQIYRGIPIGTAQPTIEELNRTQHYFIACKDITEYYNCGSYERDALNLLTKLYQSNDIVIAVGGSGLYIKALCEGMDILPDADNNIRTELNTRLQNNGLKDLLEELKQLDSAYYELVDKNNYARIIRALEVCITTGKPHSQFRKGEIIKRDFNIIKIGVDIPRDILYDRINSRVEKMFDLGLEQEARAVYKYREYNSLHTVGFTELFDFFDGKITKERAIELIKQNSRHYAKRQMTWFRKDNNIEWFNPTNIDKIIEYITQKL